ncbi:MAG TPA: thioredoxin-like domain-containing protein [Tepidisphaeraceae bacterium]|jgi:hypothetical protein|nr:thioredoxin-like domain-containing protein [Tepidisphaeraceae bacterium]
MRKRVVKPLVISIVVAFLAISLHARAVAPARPAAKPQSRPAPRDIESAVREANKQAPGATVHVNDKAKLSIELSDRTKFTGADAKGKIVLLHFWMDTEPSTNQIPELIELQAKYADSGLVMIGVNGDRELATMQAAVKKHGIPWPQHWNGYWRLNKVFKEWGIPRVPFAAVIGPDATVLYIGSASRASSEVEKAFQNHPPQMASSDDLAAAVQTIQAGESQLKEGDVLAAYKSYASVSVELRKDPVVNKAASDLRGRLYNSRDKAFVVVDELTKSGDAVDAAVALKAMTKTLAGMEGEPQAKKQLDDLMARPEVKEKVEGAERNANAASALAVARKLRDAGAEEAAYRRFKGITLDYADTPAAKEAAEMVKKYDADPAFQQKLRDSAAVAKAKPALNMAENYAKNGHVDMAKRKYQEVIDQFPDTTFADTAKKALAALK